MTQNWGKGLCIISNHIISTIYQQYPNHESPKSAQFEYSDLLKGGKFMIVDILAALACNRVGKMPSKEGKVSRFTCPIDSCGCVAFTTVLRLSLCCKSDWLGLVIVHNKGVTESQYQFCIGVHKAKAEECTIPPIAPGHDLFLVHGNVSHTHYYDSTRYMYTLAFMLWTAVWWQGI